MATKESKIEDIFQEWDKDSRINLDELDVESSKIPLLHNKYYKLYIPESLKLKKMTGDLKKIRLLKYEYYSGTLSNEECSHYGWQQFQKKLMKSDVDRYVDADSDVIQRTLKVSLQQEKVDFLADILKSLVSRGYNLRVAMDFIRFKNGA